MAIGLARMDCKEGKAMSYNLMFIDPYRNVESFAFSTKIHRMNVITGDCLHLKKTKGTIHEQIFAICRLIAIDKPDKIIFDKAGVGIGFYEEFHKYIKEIPYNKVFSVDSFGLVTYYDGGSDNGEV